MVPAAPVVRADAVPAAPAVPITVRVRGVAPAVPAPDSVPDPAVPVLGSVPVPAALAPAVSTTVRDAARAVPGSAPRRRRPRRRAGAMARVSTAVPARRA